MTPRFALSMALSTPLLTGCFATRNDMRILQGDILTMRQEAARADSARARQLGLLAQSLGVVSDSLKETGRRLTTYQGENRGQFRAIGEQVLQLQELVGQNQQVIQRLRAENEQRMQSMTQTPPASSSPATPADTVKSAPPPQQANPGPNQLYQDGLSQAQRGSYGAAQAAFEELLRLYPGSDLAPDAQYYLAEAYDADGKLAQADSAFLGVVRQYPRSPRASTSLYKMGLSLSRRGRRPEARAMMERVMREYPRTDAAELAAEWLRTAR